MSKIKNNKECQVIDYRYDVGFRGRVESEIVPTITTHSSGFSGMPMIAEQSGGGSNMEEETNLSIRKLTPIECFKLMGFEKQDLENCRDFSDAALYHVAGDSIITTVLCAIFGSMTDLNYIKIIDDYVEKLAKE